MRLREILETLDADIIITDYKRCLTVGKWLDGGCDDTTDLTRADEGGRVCICELKNGHPHWHPAYKEVYREDLANAHQRQGEDNDPWWGDTSALEDSHAD